eukprot:scaffold243473_cov26-Tisochrysis_lutea.AAC.2
MLEDTKRAGNTWMAVVFDQPVPKPGSPGKWSYSLRFNRSAVPSTDDLYSRFALGLDHRFRRYYLSGFLSVQVRFSRGSCRGPARRFTLADLWSLSAEHALRAREAREAPGTISPGRPTGSGGHQRGHNQKRHIAQGWRHAGGVADAFSRAGV